ncbi:MAG: hypothetical protein AB8I08_13530 [Sandaracinaceae bacterium]
MRTHLRRLLPCLLLLVGAPASAQQGPRASVTPTRSVGHYAGVEAGSPQPPPAYRRVQRRRQRARRRGVILTWPGFAPLGNGGSRFFIQTADPVTPEMVVEQGRVVILFRNTTIHLRNSGRWLETRFFNTPVLRARLERRRRDMALVLHLRQAAQNTVTPRVHVEAAPNGSFHYVYIDFPPGEYAAVVAPPTGVRPVGPRSGAPSGPPPAPARAADPSLDAMDNERPPGQ